MRVRGAVAAAGLLLAGPAAAPASEVVVEAGREPPVAITSVRVEQAPPRAEFTLRNTSGKPVFHVELRWRALGGAVGPIGAAASRSHPERAGGRPSLPEAAQATRPPGAATARAPSGGSGSLWGRGAEGRVRRRNALAAGGLEQACDGRGGAWRAVGLAHARHAVPVGRRPAAG